MRTLTLILALFLCACAEEAPTRQRFLVEQGASVTLNRMGGTALQYVASSPEMNAIVVEIIYFDTGAREVWAIPFGTVMAHAHRDSEGTAYCALITHESEINRPFLLRENGNGTFATTTGAACDPQKILVWHSSRPAHWRVWR